MPKPTASDVISLLEQLIKLLGPDALVREDWAQFYSGPHHSILTGLFGHTAKRLTAAHKNRSNHAKATRQAASYSAVLIENTIPGRLIDILQIYKFFEDAYGLDIISARNEADEVMRYLSRVFARAVKGHVITAVCGADRSRIFRDIEFPELINNSKIETINGVSIKTIKDLYFSTPGNPREGQDKAFRLICLAELRMSVNRAWKEATEEAVRDYIDRKSFYEIDRRNELATAGKPIPKILMVSRKERRIRTTLLKAEILRHRVHALRSRKTVPKLRVGGHAI